MTYEADHHYWQNSGGRKSLDEQTNGSPKAA